MPAVGAPRGGNKFAHPAPPPHPHPTPGIASRRTYVAPHASSHPHVAAPDYRAVGQAPHTHTAGGRGTVHQSAAQYHAAVKEVFLHQNAAGREAILRGLAHGGNVFQQETRAVHDAARFAQRQGGKEFAAAAHTAPRAFPSREPFLSGVGNYLENQIRGHLDITSPFGGTGYAATHQGEQRINSAIQALPLPKPMNKETQLAGATYAPQQIVKQGLKNLVDLPAEAAPSMAFPIIEASHGHWKAAAHMVTDPWVAMARNPAKAFAQNPVNTALMATGAAKGALRLGDPLIRRLTHTNLQRESVYLTSELTHERPNYAKNAWTRVEQRGVERTLYKRNAEGKLVPRDQAVRSRLIRLETSRLAGINERIRRVGRDEEMKAHRDAVLRSRTGRAAHATKGALKYRAPEPAVIRHAGVLSLITQGVIRRPGTFLADLLKHINSVAATRHELLDEPASLKAHDEYVQNLRKVYDQAKKDKQLSEHLQPAFRAAEHYVRDYKPLQRAAKAFGHFREMTDEALRRRELMTAVRAHMPGARFDHERGMVVDERLANGETRTRPLSTAEMERFVMRETGGRNVAYVHHDAKHGDKAFYISSQKRPQTAAEGNTLYNFSHGLTDPSHEAMLEQRVKMRGIVDAHRAMNRLDENLLIRPKDKEAYSSFADAKRDARGTDLVPIRLATPFHPKGSLKQALDTVDMNTLQEESIAHNLDINSRLAHSEEPGRWALIHKDAADQLKEHEKATSPLRFFRTFRAITAQWRKVALGTSFRHLPGVAQEHLIRMAAEGIGPVAWLAGRGALKRMKAIDPVLGRERHIELTGGHQLGQVDSLLVNRVSKHFEGTMLHAPLRAFESFMKTPGLRQLRTLWRWQTRLVINGTKRFLEDNAQTAAIGKQVIEDFGGRHGLLSAAMGHWGKMLDQAAHGLLDEKTARRMGAYLRRVYGRWTDLTPSEQSLLMFSPFGAWWTNSVAWLARFPTDHPIGAAFQAGLNTGTYNERAKYGLDMFSPHHLPLYLQGGIPLFGKIWGVSYYSAMGVAGDPGEAFTSLVLPWQSEMLGAMAGRDWKLNTITSPGNPQGQGKAPLRDILTVLGNSVIAGMVPYYTKAQTIAEGGASSFDTSTLLRPQTKEPNGGPLKGLEKAVMPIRLQKKPQSSGGSSGGFGIGSGLGGLGPGGFGVP